MYEVKKEKSFYLALTLLKYTCVVSAGAKGPHLICFWFVFIMFRLGSFIVFVILPAIHLTINIRAKTGVDVSEDFSTIFGILGAVVINFLFLMLYEKWSRFFIDLEDCNRFGIPEDIKTLRKKMNLFSVLYASYTVVGVAIYAIVASTETSYCKRFNEEHGLNEICGSFSPLVLPFELGDGFLRSLIFGTQMFLAMVTFSGSALIFFVLFEGVETIILHIRLLKRNFVMIFDKESETERKKQLRFCVLYHNNLYSLCDHLSILAKYTTGFYCMTCAVMLGCIGNLILKSKPIAGLCYLMGYIVALFMLCHGGQRLEDETSSVVDLIYDIKWYKGSVEMMKDLKFILARSQRPATLGSLPLGVMNYPLFLMIMKTSYSYLTLLNQNT